MGTSTYGRKYAAPTPDAAALHQPQSQGLLKHGMATDESRQQSLAAADEITVQAVTGVFMPATGLLSVSGDALDNPIDISRTATGIIRINGGAVAVQGGTPTVANTSQVKVSGLGGNDTITLNEANGALPRATVFGGPGNDTLTGGSAVDQLSGQRGNDTLLGKGGNDLLFGQAGNDTLIGGDGDDQMFGGYGNDRMLWNPGDDTDLMEGGAGIDTASVNGGNGGETFTATANGERVRFDRLDPAPFALDIGTTEKLVVTMNGGDDVFSATGNLGALIQLTVYGGAGHDTIRGSNGSDRLLGGDGNDFIDGQQGNDTAFLGAGDDVFQWDPGDGSDVIEGQAGTDMLLFNGSGAAESFDISANGGRVRATRNVGNITMDSDDVETIKLNTLGWADVITIHDLTGTDLTAIDIDLAGTLGGTTGDGQADTVIVDGTSASDTIGIVGSGNRYAATGLAAFVSVKNSEANDSLVINALGGDDTVDATALAAGSVRLTVDGGTGNDRILGSLGADVLLGGDNDDFVDGNQGNDVALLGAGDDVFQWDPGDGSDTVEGQDGADMLSFRGSNANENIDISPVSGRTRFFRDVANVTMDLNDLERIDFRALGGADNIVVGDLSGTDVTQIDLDLSGPAGSPDGQADTVAVNATQANDTFGVAGDADGVTVFGLQAGVGIVQFDGSDRLTLNGLGGDDVIDASGLKAGGILLTMNGGLGADVVLGGEGNDLIIGGDGDDLALMGAGDDTFVWNPGDDNDVLEGQDGFDAMLFNGANVSENIEISANGGRALFFRNVASVTMDLNDAERIDFNALGGADTINVNDLAGTDVVEVNVNLAGATGTGDAQPDTVTVDGTEGDDVTIVSGDASGVAVVGLATQVNVSGAEAASDRLVISGLAGDDVIEASAVVAGAIGLTLDGGDGNDVLIGGDGNDILIGGAGDDVLLGGLGTDILVAAPGDDIVIQKLAAGGGAERNLEIGDFLAGAGLGDLLDLSAFDVSYDWLMAHASEVAGNTVLDMGSDQITLVGVGIAELQQDDFLL